MQAFQSVLLDVWREACRHTAVSESTKAIAALLVRDLPLDQILIRRVDPIGECVETVAVGFSGPEHTQSPTRTARSADEIRKLKVWCDKGEKVCHGTGSWQRRPVCLALPQGIGDRDLLTGSLCVSDGNHGFLVLIAGPNQSFNHRHESLTKILIDPFSVAMENDRCLHEIATLREAAEADKRSLLTRLGRVHIGDPIIGEKTGLREVMERVKLVARSNAPVLVFGETGSGKELVARAIHNSSPRAEGAFIRVNCGAIAPELIDSQLFGHEKGSFTGAINEHKGWFEQADGGTLLLDEVAELPPAAQVRLLRVLQDGWMVRIGGHEPIHVDVRIIAATHRDLAAMVAEGRFREDLWYRLAVFPLVLPPLRQRREDIADMARHFAKRAAARFGLSVVLPTASDIALLSSYDWPGNTRELAAIMDRAAILGNGTCLQVAKALGVATSVASALRGLTQQTSYGSRAGVPIVSLNEAIRSHIETALSGSHGRVEGTEGAAALLGVNPNTLRAKMRKLGIDWRLFRGG